MAGTARNSCLPANRPDRTPEELAGTAARRAMPAEFRRTNFAILVALVFLGMSSVSWGAPLLGMGLGARGARGEAAFAGPMRALPGLRPRAGELLTTCPTSTENSAACLGLPLGRPLGRGGAGGVAEVLSMAVHSRGPHAGCQDSSRSASSRSIRSKDRRALKWAITPREVLAEDDLHLETRDESAGGRGRTAAARPLPGKMDAVQSTRGSLGQQKGAPGAPAAEQAAPRAEHRRSPSPSGPQGRIGSRGSRGAAAVQKRSSSPQSFTPGEEVISMPHNLTLYKSAGGLMDLLEPFVEGRPGYHMTGADAVGAMNRMKRLSERPGQGGDKARVEAHMSALAARVLDGIEGMSGKLVGLAVNAAAGQGKAFLPLMRAASRRAVQLSEGDDFTLLDVQAVGMTLNGFAKSYMRDEELFDALSLYIKRGCHQDESFRAQFNAQAVSVIVNAYVKLGFRDEALFSLLSNVAQGMPPAAFSSQAVANILNAFARHELADEALFAHLSRVAQRIPPQEYMSQHIAIILNAFAKAGLPDDRLFAFFSAEVRQRDAADFDFQAIANILNAFARNYGADADPALCQHIACMVRKMRAKAYDAQNVASILNSFVKANQTDEGLFRRMASVCMEVDPLLFDAQALSNIVHSFAKAEIRDHKLFAHMSSIARSMEYLFEAQSVALILNGFAKLEIRDQRLLDHMSRVARRLDPATFECQHVENILNAFARLDVKDAPLFKHFAQVIMAMPPSAFDAQAVAITLNAYAKILPHDMTTFKVCEFFSKQVLPFMPLKSFNPTAISIILNAYAKVEVRDERVFSTLCRAIRMLKMQGFDAHNIANMFHAFATLHVQDKYTLGVLTERLVELDVKAMQPEEVAIICWSAAVMHIQDPKLIDFLIGGLDEHINRMEANFLRQAHQFLLTCELDGLLDLHFDSDPHELDLIRIRSRSTPLQVADYLGQDFENCRTAFCSMSPEGFKKSKLQEEVGDVLQGMGVRFNEEYVDERSGYSLDLVLMDELTGGRGSTAIEVDGPSHYAVGTRVRLGRTVMKHRHMKQLGYDLKTLPYWEWDALKTKKDKVKYLQRLLQPTNTPTATLSA